MAAVKFASKCSTCGTQVAVGTGDVRKGANGKWVITCDAHKPAPKARTSAPKQRIAWDANGRAYYYTPSGRRPRPEMWIMRDSQGSTIRVLGDDVHDAEQDGFRVVGRA